MVFGEVRIRGMFFGLSNEDKQSEASHQLSHRPGEMLTIFFDCILVSHGAQVFASQPTVQVGTAMT
jgi:hypothetical protein